MLERANKPWLVWKVLYLLQSQLHGHMVSILAFSLTYSLKTHFHTCIAILAHEPFRSLCLHNLSSHIGLNCVTNFIWTITLGILDQFQQSKWLPEALKKTFQMVPKISQGNQYLPSYRYQQISQWSPSHQTLNHWYLGNCLT